jgi:cardiolipin synthase
MRAGGSAAGTRATANPIDAYVGLLEGEGASRLIAGNAVSLLVDGPHTYEAIFEAVAAARYYIDFETYIFEDDELGRRVAEKLIEAHRRGVEVNLLVDAIGARATNESFFDWLRAQGIRLVIYNPIGRMEGRNPESPNQRDHRKIVVVDGALAFTGGINVSEAYSSSAGSAGRARNAKGTRGWRDTHLRIRGPAVVELQRLFMRTWNDQGGPPLAAKHDNAQARRDGPHLVRIVASGDDDNETAIYRMYLAAIGAAQRSIHITMAYFVPDRTIIEALMAAARRGVDVQLVLPGFSDFWVVFHAGRAHYAELLDAGVIIHERRDALLHAKTAVIDGVWSTVGSANLDSRSFQLNLEVNAVVLGAPFGGQMQALFVRDVGRSVRITRDGWADRGVVPRIKELIAPLFGYWL